MKEVWKDIKGFDGKYQISNLGNVKSMSYHRGNESKLLKPREKYKIYVCCFEYQQ